MNLNIHKQYIARVVMRNMSCECKYRYMDWVRDICKFLIAVRDTDSYVFFNRLKDLNYFASYIPVRSLKVLCLYSISSPHYITRVFPASDFSVSVFTN